MAELVWDELESRFAEAGVEKVAIYLMLGNYTYGSGAAWNGVASIVENAEAEEGETLLDDGKPYLYLPGDVSRSLNLTAYTFPDLFYSCLGVEADTGHGGTYNSIIVPDSEITDRYRFALVFLTKKANASVGMSYGEVLHIYYNLMADVSEETERQTIGSDVEPVSMQFVLHASYIPTDSLGRVTHVEINSDDGLWQEPYEYQDEEDPITRFEALKRTLYGYSGSNPTLILPDDLLDFGIETE